jgi:hypothetical protein
MFCVVADTASGVIDENQFSFAGPGDWRFWHWHHRILPDGVAAGYCQRRGRLNPGGGNADQRYAIGVMVGAPLMTLLLSHRARAMR